jgi:hypothetical protein
MHARLILLQEEQNKMEGMIRRNEELMKNTKEETKKLSAMAQQLFDALELERQGKEEKN